MKKAIFLDRDGVINSPADNYYVWKPEDFIPNVAIAELCIKLQEKGYLLIVISNQGGVGRGAYSRADVDKFHHTMTDYFKELGVHLTAIYYCPHHESSGKCFCRKPNSLMLEKAMARFNIDSSQSYMIGDSLRDIQAAEKAGVKGIKIEKDKIDMEAILAEIDPSEQIVRIMQKIYDRRLTTTSGGNISIRDSNNNIWVTPSAVDKGNLKREDILLIKADGTLCGKHKPSIEYPFHKAIYDKCADVNAIVHAHPSSLVSFCITHTVPETRVLPNVYLSCGDVGYAKYQMPGSHLLGQAIAQQFADGKRAVIMENHGLVLGANDIQTAYQRFEQLELCARTTISAKKIGTPQLLSDQQIKQYQSNNNKIIVSPETPLTSEEKEKEKLLMDLSMRAYRQGLFYCLSGMASIRTNANNFLITSADCNRSNPTEKDVLHIKTDTTMADSTLSGSYLMHRRIYETHPEVNAIITAQPEYLMAYAITHQPLNVKVITESWLFIRNIGSVGYSTSDESLHLLAQQINKNTPGLIIENDCAVLTGNNLLQAFDRLEVAEFSAKSLIEGGILGKFVPLEKEQITELEDKFKL